MAVIRNMLHEYPVQQRVEFAQISPGLYCRTQLDG